MAFPEHADFLIIGAGIHGLSTACKLANRLIEKGEAVEGRIGVVARISQQVLTSTFSLTTDMLNAA